MNNIYFGGRGAQCRRKWCVCKMCSNFYFIGSPLRMRAACPTLVCMWLIVNVIIRVETIRSYTRVQLVWQWDKESHVAVLSSTTWNFSWCLPQLLHHHINFVRATAPHAEVCGGMCPQFPPVSLPMSYLGVKLLCMYLPPKSSSAEFLKSLVLTLNSTIY